MLGPRVCYGPIFTYLLEMTGARVSQNLTQMAIYAVRALYSILLGSGKRTFSKDIFLWGVFVMYLLGRKQVIKFEVEI